MSSWMRARLATAGLAAPSSIETVTIAALTMAALASVLVALLTGPLLPLGFLVVLGTILVLILRPEAAPIALLVQMLAIWSRVTDKASAHALGFTWYANDWMLVAAVLGLFLSWSAGRAPIRLAVPLHWPSVVLAGVMTAFAIRSLGLPVLRQDLFYDLRPFVYYLAALLVPFAVRTTRELLRVAWTAILAGTIGSAWGIVRSLTGKGFELYGLHLHFTRLTGPSEFVSAVTLLAALGLLLFETRPGRRVVLFVALAVSAVACYLTYARGTYVAVGAAVVVLLAVLGVTNPRKAVAAALAFSAAVLVTVLVLHWAGIPIEAGFTKRVGAISLGNVDISVGQRLLEWNAAYSEWRAHPLFGNGLGHRFSYLLPPATPVSTVFCHNSFIYVGMKTGLFGLVVFLGFLTSWAWTLVRALRHVPPGVVRGIVLGWLAIFTYAVVKSLSTWLLNADTSAPYFGLLVGAAAAVAAAPGSFAESVPESGNSSA